MLENQSNVGTEGNITPLKMSPTSSEAKWWVRCLKKSGEHISHFVETHYASVTFIGRYNFVETHYASVTFIGRYNFVETHYASVTFIGRYNK